MGAGIALRVRVSSAPKNIRGVTPGLFLYIGATPGLRTDGGHDNPGGLTPAPNVAQAGWTLCADSYCNAVLKHGPLPAAAGPVVGRWHTTELEVTDNVASGSIDRISIFSGVGIAPSLPPPPPPPPPPPTPPVVQQCTTNTTLLPSNKAIAGGDYQQVLLPPSANASAHIEFCARSCCADSTCSAWAIAKGKCWLKHTGWSIEVLPEGEDACAVRPGGPVPPPTPPHALVRIPPSGWAGIAATLGLSQVDNFKLRGTCLTSRFHA